MNTKHSTAIRLLTVALTVAAPAGLTLTTSTSAHAGNPCSSRDISVRRARRNAASSARLSECPAMADHRIRGKRRPPRSDLVLSLLAAPPSSGRHRAAQG